MSGSIAQHLLIKGRSSFTDEITTHRLGPINRYTEVHRLGGQYGNHMLNANAARIVRAFLRNRT